VEDIDETELEEIGRRPPGSRSRGGACLLVTKVRLSPEEQSQLELERAKRQEKREGKTKTRVK